MYLNLGMLVGGGRNKARRFYPRINALLAPEIYTGNWAYLCTLPTTGTAYTITSGAAINFGFGWIEAADATTIALGTPAGTRKVAVRGPASAAHATPVTYTAVIGEVSLGFTITTHAEGTEEDVLFGGDPDVQIDGVDVVW
jgi:hypothetical protein